MNKAQRKNKNKRLYLSPMMPKQYNSKKRAEIREKEREILGGK